MWFILLILKQAKKTQKWIYYVNICEKIEEIYDYIWSHFLETETLIKLSKGSGVGGAGWEWGFSLFIFVCYLILTKWMHCLFFFVYLFF